MPATAKPHGAPAPIRIKDLKDLRRYTDALMAALGGGGLASDLYLPAFEEEGLPFGEGDDREDI